MDSSPFIRLPAEIRNSIYEHLFTTGYAVTLKQDKILHPITMTCRQLRRETLRMYLSLTAFNAHLDDGPSLPLARWLSALGPDLCLALKEVNVWDLHMLNGRLHGVATTRHKLRNDQGDEVDQYMLQSLGRREHAHTTMTTTTTTTWFLQDVRVPLQRMGIGLERFCIVLGDGVSLKLTSSFALRPARELFGGSDTDALAGEFGIGPAGQDLLDELLDRGVLEVRLLEGRRVLGLDFDEELRLVGMREEFVLDGKEEGG